MPSYMKHLHVSPKRRQMSHSPPDWEKVTTHMVGFAFRGKKGFSILHKDTLTSGVRDHVTGPQVCRSIFCLLYALCQDCPQLSPASCARHECWTETQKAFCTLLLVHYCVSGLINECILWFLNSSLTAFSLSVHKHVFIPELSSDLPGLFSQRKMLYGNRAL